ncbi:hypothetical protein K502DRAFT_325770 [Neoconidiobolus thromboides FSU 785]|nr:hypothetical protein K502DRAFT_325770 [Neoconidiobolus thromboides FSU 785]
MSIHSVEQKTLLSADEIDEGREDEFATTSHSDLEKKRSLLTKWNLNNSLNLILKQNNEYAELISPTGKNERNSSLFFNIKENEMVNNELFEDQTLEDKKDEEKANGKREAESEILKLKKEEVKELKLDELSLDLNNKSLIEEREREIDHEDDMDPMHEEEDYNGLEEHGSIYLNKIKKNQLEQEIVPEIKNKNTIKFTFWAQKQKFKDVFFLLLYIGYTLSFLIVNIIMFWETSQSSLIAKYTSTTIFRAIKESLLAVTINILSSIIIGCIWLYSLCLIPKNVIWFLFLSMPAFSMLTSLWMVFKGHIGFSFIYGEGDPSLGSYIFSIFPLLMAISHGFIIHRYHSSVKQAIDIVQMTCTVLKNNLEIFSMSLMCLGINILFTCIWLISFDRLFLLGHLEATDKDNQNKIWILNSNLKLLIPYYCLFYFWTTSLINNIERSCIAGTVSQWYFYQKEYQFLNGYHPTKIALKRSLTTSLGSLSFASLVMAFCNCLKLLKTFYINSPKINGQKGRILRILFFPILIIANLVESISFYTVSYIGISGKSFLKSSKLATSILRKRMNQIFLSAMIIRITIYSAILLGCIISGFAFYCFSADTLHTNHFLIVGLIGVGIPFYIFKFLMNILLYSSDAIYICYNIDLDNKTVHNSLAHKTLSN